MAGQHCRSRMVLFLVLALGVAGRIFGGDSLSGIPGLEKMFQPAPEFVRQLVPADAEVNCIYSNGCGGGGYGGLGATRTIFVPSQSGSMLERQTSYFFDCFAIPQNSSSTAPLQEHYQRIFEKDGKALREGNLPKGAQPITLGTGIGYIKASNTDTTYSGQFYDVSETAFIRVSITNAASAGEVNEFIANARAISGAFAELITACP